MSLDEMISMLQKVEEKLNELEKDWYVLSRDYRMEQFGRFYQKYYPTFESLLVMRDQAELPIFPQLPLEIQSQYSQLQARLFDLKERAFPQELGYQMGEDGSSVGVSDRDLETMITGAALQGFANRRLGMFADGTTPTPEKIRLAYMKP